MKTRWMVIVCMLALVGCATKVPLDAVPVETAEPEEVIEQPQDEGAASAVDTSQPAPSELLPPAEPAAEAAAIPHTIYFDYDSAMIRPEFQSVIAAHANNVLGNATRRLVLEGHADETGSREYNLALGQRRAEAVRNALTILGVPPAQIEAISYGEEKPAVLGFTEDAYIKNRRVEVRYP